jgi:glycosyltransferase involved in cell wall biosynthesis
MVSIVIPLYNKASHIRRALDSVLAQTVRAYEIIVVDDGSTDGGGDVVRTYADPRVRLVTQANAGVSSARNRGVWEASGELIAFLDADDEWLEDFLETVLQLRERFPEAAVWGTAYLRMEADGGIQRNPSDTEHGGGRDGFLVDLFRFSVRYHQPCNCSSTMFCKVALLKVGGFPCGLARLEDTNTLFRLALRYPVAYCPVPKSVYHLDAENRSDKYLWSGNFPFFEDARRFLRETGGGRRLGADVEQYLGYMHAQGLYRNWLAGNHAAMREIIRDCRAIRGYRLKCFLWQSTLWIPHSLSCIAWKLQSRLRGYDGKLPPTRSIYRPSVPSKVEVGEPVGGD